MSSSIRSFSLRKFLDRSGVAKLMACVVSDAQQ
jgi:hypothetical protein